MMARFNVLIILILFFLVPSFSQNLEVKLIKNLPPNLELGGKNTVIVRIINKDSKDINLNVSLITPGTWRTFYNKTVNIKENSSSILPISIISNVTTAPGSYDIDINLSSDKINYQKKIKLTTSVLKKIDIEVELISVPKISFAGKDVQANFEIQNNGNSRRRVHLSSKNGSINGSRNLILDVGESKIVNVYSETDDSIIKNTKRTIDLIVSSGPFRTTKSTSVTILSSRKSNSSRYFQLPTEISAMYLNRDFGTKQYSGFQGNLLVQGSLNDSNDKYLEILARGPDQFDNSILGLYDEYHLSYNSNNLNFYVGDNSYSLTRLTENGRYGTGISGTLSDNNNEIGFFYVQPRFSPINKEEIAAFFTYKYDETNSIGVAFLQKYQKNIDEPLNVYSAQYTIKPLEELAMDVEYSFGKMNNKFGNGYNISLSNQTEKLYVSAQLLDASKNFPGYYNNTRYLNGNLQYIVNERLRFFSNFHQDESNAQRDTLYGVSPSSKIISGGLSYSYRGKDYVSAVVGFQERKDRMPLEKFHYEEYLARISFINSLYSFQSTLNGEMASTKNILAGIDGISYKTSLALRYTPSRKISLNCFVQYYDTYRYSSDKLKEVIIGTKSSINFAHNTQVDISFQNSYNIEDYYQDRSLLDFRMSKTFIKNHSVEFSIAHAIKQKTVNTADTFVGLKYTFNFGLPIKRIKNLGTLRGRLINEGVDKIGNIVLNLDGRLQVSDEDGLFIFSDIPPGEHYLYIDNSSLELNDIANIKLPMLVNIKPNELTDMQISLTKAGAIKGKVKLNVEDQFADKFIKEDSNIKKNVVVEIAMGNEVFREIVDLNSDFSFLGVRPGTWILKVYHNNLSNKYIIKNSEMIINLESGETSIKDIDVIKKARRIQFQPTEIIVN